MSSKPLDLTLDSDFTLFSTCYKSPDTSDRSGTSLGLYLEPTFFHIMPEVPFLRPSIPSFYFCAHNARIVHDHHHQSVSKPHSALDARQSKYPCHPHQDHLLDAPEQVRPNSRSYDPAQPFSHLQCYRLRFRNEGSPAYG